MIPDLLQILTVPRSPRISQCRLTSSAIQATFTKIRKKLNAHTLHTEVRKRHSGSGVVWSVWIGRFDKPLQWLSATRFQERRYALVLALEYGKYVGVLSSNAGEVAHLFGGRNVSYEKLLAFRAEDGTEVEGLSTRGLRTARAGVTRSTLSGRHLEQVVSRVGASQVAPSGLALREGDQGWRISPGTGRVAMTGQRVALPELCDWFAHTCEEIKGAGEPSHFLKAFAHPVSLDSLPDDIEPISLQLDHTILEELLDNEVTLTRAEQDLDDKAIADLRQLIGDLWLVCSPREPADKQAGIWRLTSGGKEVGHLTFRSTKISLRSERLHEVEVTYKDGATATLLQIFNGGEQPFRIAFANPTYTYSLGQLFRDHRLLGSRDHLLDVLNGRLPPGCEKEKEAVGSCFAPESLFGIVVNDVSSGEDDLLVCDDLGSEWADFIGVSTKQHRVTFYHCKGGSVDVGASDLHEVVAQATKNLGYLTASTDELQARCGRWGKKWNASVARLQRGESVATFVAAFARAVAAPQATRRVVVVTSGLSKAELAKAFAGLDGASPRPEAVHVLWLLSAFVDQCRSVGAVPEIVCRP